MKNKSKGDKYINSGKSKTDISKKNDTLITNQIYPILIIVFILISGLVMAKISESKKQTQAEIDKKNEKKLLSKQVIHDYSNYDVKSKYFMFYSEREIEDIKDDVDNFCSNNYSDIGNLHLAPNSDEVYSNIYDNVLLEGLKAFSVYDSLHDLKYYECAKHVYNSFEKLMSEDGKFIINENARIYDNYYAPWYSSKTNGYFLSLLTRIYSVEKDNKMIQVGKKALSPYKINIENGGSVGYFLDYKIYETYPSMTNNTYNLHGFIISLIGIKEFSVISYNESAKQLYLDGINSLEHIIALYDDEQLSHYDLAHYSMSGVKNTSKYYHKLNINGLEVIDFFNHKKIFRFYIDKWNDYLKKN